MRGNWCTTVLPTLYYEPDTYKHVKVLEVRDLRVKYGDFLAVDGLSFSVDNEVYCLLGPNGAGKTSTLKAIMHMVPFTGEIKVLGRSNREREVKNMIGYVPEQPTLFEHMTPLELLEFAASLRGVRDLSRINVLVKALSLDWVMNEPVASLSMGNRQRVSIVLALIHNPKLLILDEAFNGLDVVSTRVLREIVNSHLRESGGVVFSTHIMEVAEKMCSRIGIIKSGRMLVETTPDKVREAGKSLEDLFLSVTGLDEEVREILRGLS